MMHTLPFQFLVLFALGLCFVSQTAAKDGPRVSSGPQVIEVQGTDLTGLNAIGLSDALKRSKERAAQAVIVDLGGITHMTEAGMEALAQGAQMFGKDRFAAATLSGEPAALVERQGYATPNIILILADDLGYGDLSLYGQKYYQTNNLDELARQGAYFTSFYSGSPVCAPSRCSLLTGQHTGRCSIRGNHGTLLPEERTIADHLKGLGYTTAAIGKWAVGAANTAGAPWRKGFDYFFGFLSQNRAHNYYPSWVYENQERFEIAENESAYGIATKKSTYIHDLFVEKAIDFIGNNAERPFFLYLPLTLPHQNNELKAVSWNGMEAPSRSADFLPDFSEEERGRASMVLAIDETVGRLTEELKRVGIAQDTVIIFTSDNGAFGVFDKTGRTRLSLNSNLRSHKGRLYEGGIRVPFIIHYPEHITPGTTVSSPWAAWDILPSIAEIADGTTDKTDGVSFVATLIHGSDPSVDPDERLFYWELPREWFLQAVRQGDWKAVRHGGELGRVQLYDLSIDLGESTDVASDYPLIAERLKHWMDTLSIPADHWPTDPAAFEFIDEPPYTPKVTFKKDLLGYPTGARIVLLEQDGCRGSFLQAHLHYLSRGRLKRDSTLYPTNSTKGLEDLAKMVSQEIAVDRGTQFFFCRKARRSQHGDRFIEYLRSAGVDVGLRNKYPARNVGSLWLYQLLKPMHLLEISKNAERAASTRGETRNVVPE